MFPSMAKPIHLSTNAKRSSASARGTQSPKQQKGTWLSTTRARSIIYAKYSQRRVSHLPGFHAPRPFCRTKEDESLAIPRSSIEFIIRCAVRTGAGSCSCLLGSLTFRAFQLAQRRARDSQTFPSVSRNPSTEFDVQRRTVTAWLPLSKVSALRSHDVLWEGR